MFTREQSIQSRIVDGKDSLPHESEGNRRSRFIAGNTNGTLNFQSRIHKFALKLKLAHKASAKNPFEPNLRLKYLDTARLTSPLDGNPTTSLDTLHILGSHPCQRKLILAMASAAWQGRQENLD